MHPPCLMSLPISHNPQSLPQSLRPISNQYINPRAHFRGKSCPWPHSPIMQAHPQSGNLPSRQVPPSMSQHAWRTNQRAYTSRLVHATHESLNQASASLPYSPLPLHSPCSRSTCHRFLSTAPSPHGRISTSLIPQSLFNRQKKLYYKAGPHAPDSSARIGDCRKAYDKLPMSCLSGLAITRALIWQK